MSGGHGDDSVFESAFSRDVCLYCQVAATMLDNFFNYFQNSLKWHILTRSQLSVVVHADPPKCSKTTKNIIVRNVRKIIIFEDFKSKS